MRRALLVLISTLALAFAAVPASAVVKLPLPQPMMHRSAAPCPPPMPRTPSTFYSRAGYCPNTTWRKQLNDAYSWAVHHPYKYQRSIVQFPDPYAPSVTIHRHNTYVVYVVLLKFSWQDGEPNRVFKYGIIRVSPWQHRANVGRSMCQGLGLIHRCRIDWVSSNYGWYSARFAEASMTSAYQRTHGLCPPGMPVCR